jgi:Icc protein
MESTVTSDAESRGAAGDAIRILQVSDLHFFGGGVTPTAMFGMDTEQSFVATAAAALESVAGPDLVLATGDLVQKVEPEAYRRVRERLLAFPCPIYCLPGNHDDAGLMRRELVGEPIRWQCSIPLDHWQIICLDSTIPNEPQGRLSPDQLKRLETLLAGDSRRFALIALHHHPVPCGSRWMDSMLLENSDEFFSILARHEQVRGVAFGHVHQEMDLRHHGLRILGAPSTCFQFKPNSAGFALEPLPPGFRWLRLFPDGRIETEVGRAQHLPEGLDFSQQGY